ncbi:M23 family metallopeptidase [Nocardia brevicatena]|uniref:M23 family metallopeptidase n=1 Tax=Nocardia brevicatena TaxID=37327 RepID=UPI00068609F2
MSAGHDTDQPEATGTDADDGRSSLRRAAAAGGGVVLPSDWRTRARHEPKWLRATLHVPPERLRSIRALPATALRNRPTRDDLRALLDRRPSAEDIGATLRRHRALIGAVGLTLVLAAGDGTFGTLVTDRPPGPAERLRVAVAHPLQVQITPPSARRYLDAIDTGERLREQAVVAAAARATLERAKAEAAAAAAGQAQPWINSAPAPDTLPPDVIPPGAIPPGSGGVVLPALGTFTSGFGQRWGTFHRGIDIAGPIGTPIYAVAAGTVIDAGPAAGFGLWVRIRHDDGTISVYGHMYDFFVSVGERVPAGMQIARMGNRGDSTGPHLHFEIIVDGRHVDPQRWLALHGLGYG